MVFSMNEDARNCLVEVIGALIDAGDEPGRCELLDFQQRTLAVLKFSRPSAGTPRDGTLNFNRMEQDPAARASGLAVMARIVDGDGTEVFRCDVSDERGNGVIKLNSNQITAGGPIRIDTFSISYPA